MYRYISVLWHDQSPQCYGLQSTCKLIQIHEASEVTSSALPLSLLEGSQFPVSDAAGGACTYIPGTVHTTGGAGGHPV